MGPGEGHLLPGQLEEHLGYGQLLTAYHPNGDNKEALETFLVPSCAEPPVAKVPVSSGRLAIPESSA